MSARQAESRIPLSRLRTSSPLPTEKLNPSGPPAKLKVKIDERRIRSATPPPPPTFTPSVVSLKCLLLEYPAGVEERQQCDRAQVAERQQVVAHFEVAQQQVLAGETSGIEAAVGILPAQHRYLILPRRQ